jgi:TPR repeat protein
MKKLYFIVLLSSITICLSAQTKGLYVDNGNGAVAAPSSEKRFALIIGNNNYLNNPLKNPINDATDMSESLQSLGFEVEMVKDANRVTMTSAIQRLGKKAKGINSVALFYFSGHGLQVKNDNFLIPVDASVKSEPDVEVSCISLNYLMRQLEEANTGTNIIVLDACRNNPFSYNRNTGGGLATPSRTPTGTYIAFATSPLTTAADGTGRNSPYTAALVKAVKEPNIKIEEAFKLVRREVKRIGQIPWENSSMDGDFYFNPTAAGGVKPVVKPKSPSNNSTDDSQITEELEYAAKAYDQKDYNAAFPILYKYRSHILVHERYFYYIGKMFQLGKGVAKDNDEALKYYTKAADKGYAQAQNALGGMFHDGYGVNRDYKMAVLWYKKAAEQGYASAQNNLAYMYTNGYGVTKNYEEAIKWLKKAVEQGDPVAQNSFGYMLHKGIGVTKDVLEAVNWYKKAGEQGLTEAQYTLATMFKNGEGVAKSKENAIFWYEKASKLGNKEATKSLKDLKGN